MRILPLRKEADTYRTVRIVLYLSLGTSFRKTIKEITIRMVRKCHH
jgi:hypothetical protein